MKNKFIVSSVLVFSMLFSQLIPAAFATSFSDVGSSEVYKDGIEFLKSQNIVNGYSDGTFKPAQTINRAEMIKIIAEGAKTYFSWPADVFSGYEKKSCFTDVSANQWYTKYVCYAKEKGWVVGYDGGKTFKPTQEVTFVEGLKISYKGFGLAYSETGTPWYKDVVDSASVKNYIPFDIKAFSGSLKRNQMADLVTRIIKENDGQLDAYLGARKDIVVTYETITAGQDMSQMDVTNLPDGATPTPPADDTPVAATLTIHITAAGFSPSAITINKGDTVTFINDDSSTHRPASNNHPTHTAYPGSSADKCGTAQQAEAFDSCAALATGDTYSFIFSEIGTWGYHDHFNPTVNLGTITVQ